MNRKILLLQGDAENYTRPFKVWGDLRTNYDSLEDCDLVVFTGGTDVDPALYGDTVLTTTDDRDIDRDALEQAVYTRALLLGIPMVGICRGAQFICVMNGGKLIQNVDSHGSCVHKMHRCEDKHSIEVKGDHHQMMWPVGEFNMLAYADGLSNSYSTGDNLDSSEFVKEFTVGLNVQEPEVVHWPLTRCLSVQFHPEWHRSIEPASFYFQELLDNLVM